MKMRIKLVLAFAATLCVVCAAWSAPVDRTATGGGLPAILDSSKADSNYLPDFSYAGYDNGNSELPLATGQVIAVAEFGAVPDDAKDDSAAILAAIDKANSVDGAVIISFESGQYRVTEILKIVRSDIVLRGKGSGASGTTLLFTRPLNQVDKGGELDELRDYLVELDKRQVEPDNNLDEIFSEYSWSGGFIWIQKEGARPYAYLDRYDTPGDEPGEVAGGTRGSREIELATGTSVEPGSVVRIQWFSDRGPESGIIKSIYGDDIEVGSHHWTSSARPLVQQTTRVESVRGSRATISDPLLHDISENIPAKISQWDPLTHVGIEDLHIEFPDSPNFGHHIEKGYNGIYVTGVFDGWIRDVRITNADSGILTYDSANITIRNIRTEGKRTAHYAIHMGNVHNVLAEGLLIFNPVRHSLSFNTQSTKGVFKDAEVFTNPVLDQHAGANHQNLFDNVTFYTHANRSDSGPTITVFDGSGAPYWQPGHGGYSTTWNLDIRVSSGAEPDETVTVLGLDEGPRARVIGLHGNRKFKLDYRPTPYVDRLNNAIRLAPSLYEYQRMTRLTAD